MKGGPKDVPGVFKEGKIAFPDGNVWPKEAGVAGVYLDPQHKEGYRVVRVTSPSTVQIDLQDEPKAEVLKLAGTSATDKEKGETTIKIDFSVKGGPKDVPGVFKDDKIAFPDGNVWSKF